MPSTCDLIKNIAEAFEIERDELKRDIEQMQLLRQGDRQEYQRILDRLAELETSMAELAGVAREQCRNHDLLKSNLREKLQHATMKALDAGLLQALKALSGLEPAKEFTLGEVVSAIAHRLGIANQELNQAHAQLRAAGIPLEVRGRKEMPDTFRPAVHVGQTPPTVVDDATMAKLLELSELGTGNKFSLAEIAGAIGDRIENLEFDNVAEENSRHIQFEGTFDAMTSAVSDLMRTVHEIYAGGSAVIPWLATIKLPDGTLHGIQGESLEQLQRQVAHAVFPEITADLEKYVRQSIEEKTAVVVEKLERDAQQNPPWRVVVRDRMGVLHIFAAYGPETLISFVVQKFGRDKVELPAQAPRAVDETPRASDATEAQKPTPLDESNAAMRAAVEATNAAKASRDAREAG